MKKQFFFNAKLKSLFLTICAVIFINMVDAMDDANRILAEYPNGWTCIEDVSKFCCKIDFPYFSDSETSEEESVSLEDMVKSVVEIINKAYERTKIAIHNDDFIISSLFLGVGSEHFGTDFNKLLDNFVAENMKTHSKNKNILLREAIWRIQREAIMQRDDKNINYGLIYECIHMFALDNEDFIRDEIIPVMRKYGLERVIPYPYCDKY